MNNKFRVLIVDTDVKFLSIAEEKLSDRGFLVQTTTTSKEAIKILELMGCDSLLISFSNESEKKAIFDFVDAMEVKPIIFQSNIFTETNLPAEM